MQQIVHSHGRAGLSVRQEISGHFTFAFDLDFATACEFISLSIFQNLQKKTFSLKSKQIADKYQQIDYKM